MGIMRCEAGIKKSEKIGGICGWKKTKGVSNFWHEWHQLTQIGLNLKISRILSASGRLILLQK